MHGCSSPQGNGNGSALDNVKCSRCRGRGEVLFASAGIPNGKSRSSRDGRLLPFGTTISLAGLILQVHAGVGGEAENRAGGNSDFSAVTGVEPVDFLPAIARVQGMAGDLTDHFAAGCLDHVTL